MEDSPPDTDFIDNADLIEAAALGEILTDGDREAGLPREEAASLLARTRIAEKRIHILNEIEEVILEISDDQELAEDPTEWELPNKVAKGLVIKKNIERYIHIFCPSWRGSGGNIYRHS